LRERSTSPKAEVSFAGVRSRFPKRMGRSRQPRREGVKAPICLQGRVRPVSLFSCYGPAAVFTRPSTWDVNHFATGAWFTVLTMRHRAKPAFLAVLALVPVLPRALSKR